MKTNERITYGMSKFRLGLVGPGSAKERSRTSVQHLRKQTYGNQMENDRIQL